MRLIPIVLLSIAACITGCAYFTMENKLDIQGHRGCRGLMPENTIIGFKKALDLGVTTLELDLSVNGDGDVIVSHEPFFNHEISTKPDGSPVSKEEELSLNVFKMSQDEIETYDVGLLPHSRFQRQKKVAATKPRLADMVNVIEHYAVLSKYPSPLYNMEIKRRADVDGLYHPTMEIFADKVIKTIADLDIADRTTVQCFDVETLNYLHEKYNHKKLVYLIENNDGFDSNMQKLNFIPFVYSPYYELVDEKMVKKCSQQNILLIPWTVNDATATEKLILMGVDGIISDYPDMVIEVYESMN